MGPNRHINFQKYRSMETMPKDGEAESLEEILSPNPYKKPLAEKATPLSALDTKKK